MTDRFYSDLDRLPAELEFESASGVVSEIISKTLNSAPAQVSEIMRHAAKTQGKGARTQLLLSAAMNSDGFVPRDAAKAASAVELFHLATLIHDDIIDEADTRRGEASVQSKFGKWQAVISGDYLLALALSSIADLSKMYEDDRYAGLVPEFAQAATAICCGELGELKNNANLELHVSQYLKIISGKTAALFSVSAYAGALIGGADAGQIKLCGRFGRLLGMVFQIVDDCKDYEFTENRALKPVKSDLEQGVVTLPLIMAFLKEPQLREMAVNVFLSKANPAALVSEVVKAGGTVKAMAFASKYCEKARLVLDRMEQNEKRERFASILGKAYQAAAVF
ncbi:MAG: polyprenyl synthetase family protein [Clostridiales bacterium]|nr:polyprenyl synthetase family protein [Clostridiales bacterium]